MSEHDAVLKEAFEQARRYLARVRDRPVRPQASVDALRGALGGPLPEEGVEPRQVVEDLARTARAESESQGGASG
jgi:hypothetical protein